jgi:hypothetical protein
MRKPWYIIVLLTLAFGAHAQSTRVEQSILDLSKKKFEWLINKQYDSLLVLLDDKLQYVHSNGWVENKQEVIDDLKNGKLTYQKVTVKESSVRLYEKTAIVNGLGTFEGIGNGNAFSMDLRYTEVYVRTGNRWKLASRHSNRMP